MVFVDAHCHLFDIKRYDIPNDILPVVVGYSDSSNRKASALASEKNYPFVLGIAPQTALKEGLGRLEDWISFIRGSRPNAIGEIGLDYKWASSSGDVEKERTLFRKMIALADEMKLPMVIHSRDKPNDIARKDDGVPIGAVDECIEMMEEFIKKNPTLWNEDIGKL